MGSVRYAPFANVLAPVACVSGSFLLHLIIVRSHGMCTPGIVRTRSRSAVERCSTSAGDGIDGGRITSNGHPMLSSTSATASLAAFFLFHFCVDASDSYGLFD